MGTKIEEIRGKFVIFFCSLPGEGSGRVLGGFGEDFGRVLEGFGRPGEPEWRPKWRKFVDVSPPCPRMAPGEGLGRIWEGFGGFCKDLEGF